MNVKIKDDFDTLKKYHRLTILGQPFRIAAKPNRTQSKQYRWIVVCKCDCSIIDTYYLDHIIHDHTKSCGCFALQQQKIANIKHNMYGTRIYHIWNCMIQRCDNSKNPNYIHYGKRGVNVCKEWKADFT